MVRVLEHPGSDLPRAFQRGDRTQCLIRSAAKYPPRPPLPPTSTTAMPLPVLKIVVASHDLLHFSNPWGTQNNRRGESFSRFCCSSLIA